MKEYKNKEKLILEIKKTANLFINEFKDIDDIYKDKLLNGINHTPSQMIVYQLGWMSLIRSWDNNELNQKEVITPTPNYKWNNLGGLYQSFYDEYKSYSLSCLQNNFIKSVDDFKNWVNDFSDKELFDQDIRKWASSTLSRWSTCKWVYINTIAPFKSLRSKIKNGKN